MEQPERPELPSDAIYYLDMSLLNITKMNLSLKVFSYFHSGFPDCKPCIINDINEDLFYGLVPRD
jgi:hypothetical protein